MNGLAISWTTALEANMIPTFTFSLFNCLAYKIEADSPFSDEDFWVEELDEKEALLDLFKCDKNVVFFEVVLSLSFSSLFLLDMNRWLKRLRGSLSAFCTNVISELRNL